MGAAFNKTLITTLLRGYMGFKGYVNTDSGVMCNPPAGVCTDWGVQSLTIPQRYAKAVQAGVNLFSESQIPQALIDTVTAQHGFPKEARAFHPQLAVAAFEGVHLAGVAGGASGSAILSVTLISRR